MIWIFVVFALFCTGAILYLMGVKEGFNISQPVIDSSEEYIKLLKRHFDAKNFVSASILDYPFDNVDMLLLLKILSFSHRIVEGLVIYDPDTKMFANVYEDKNPYYTSPKTDWV